MSLVLKDALGADVTLVKIGSTPTGAVYEKKDAMLFGRIRCSLSLTENGKTNRVRGKLTVPTLGENPSGVPNVQYTEIGSFDYSVYRAGTAEGRANMDAMFKALVASATATAAVVEGITPGSV